MAVVAKECSNDSTCNLVKTKHSILYHEPKVKINMAAKSVLSFSKSIIPVFFSVLNDVKLQG